VIILPDNGDPGMSLPQDYNLLSADWTEQMNAHVADDA
jgi:hypothetical protein